MTRIALVLLAIAALTVSAAAQTIQPPFDVDYEYVSLGSVPGVPTFYGGVTFKAGDENTLLIGGAANGLNAIIYEIPVVRGDDGSIIAWACGDAVPFADAYGNSGGIDGGLQYGPGGVLFYTSYNDNYLGQILPGSTEPDRLIALTPLGVNSSTGTLQFVPEGFSGAGRLKILSFNASTWHDATVSPAGDGTYDIAVEGRSILIGGGPEGLVFIAGGNPQFPADSVLVSEYTGNRVVAYETDDNGDPILETQRVFLDSLVNAEGATIDPVTGDFIFSTFGGGNQVVVVSGFNAAPPCTADLDNNGVVNGADLGLMLGAWGEAGGGFGDLTFDCIVDGADLGVLLGQWGSCGSS